MGGAVRGHDGARRRLARPIHTTLRARMETILGLGLLTIRLGIGFDQPGNNGLRNLALLDSGGVEACEVEQRVGVDHRKKP